MTKQMRTGEAIDNNGVGAAMDTDRLVSSFTVQIQTNLPMNSENFADNQPSTLYYELISYIICMYLFIHQSTSTIRK